MPIIQINNFERLISTPRVWEWQKKKIRKHRTDGADIIEWAFFRNYMTLENALNDIAKSHIRISMHADILAAINEEKNALVDLCKAITAQIKTDSPSNSLIKNA